MTTTHLATKPGRASSSRPADAPAARLHFAFAQPADDAELRTLLLRNPMRGVIRVGFAHEPDYFAGTSIAGAEDRTLLAREDGRLVAAGRCVIRPCWLNGGVRRCAYLGELRLDASVLGRAEIVLRGYAFFAAEYARDPADFCFTSIIADNTRARRLLERGARHLPRYEFLDEFNTLLLRPRAGSAPALPAGVELVTGDRVPGEQLARLLDECNRPYNLAPHWTAECLARLGRHGLKPADFLVLRRGGALLGCVAVWDQRSFRQIMVHGYASWLSFTRPLANLLSPVFAWPSLPAPGTPLAQAFLSPLAATPEATALLPALVRAALDGAARRGLDCVALGLAGRHPLWPAISRTFRGRHYASRLYAVNWPDSPAKVGPLDARPLQPEPGFL